MFKNNLWFIWDLFIWGVILFLITQYEYSYWWLFMSFFLTTLPPRDKPKYVIIENPRGKLRKLDLIPYKIHTVAYCKYGDTRMKPTDIWTNINGFIPKMCNNGNSDHISAPRGSYTGTQNSKLSYYDKCKIPPLLIKDLINSI